MIPPLGFDEHPSASLAQWRVLHLAGARRAESNPKVWSKTVLVVMYDENDGWFDHVPPPGARRAPRASI